MAVKISDFDTAALAPRRAQGGIAAEQAHYLQTASNQFFECNPVMRGNVVETYVNFILVVFRTDIPRGPLHR